MPISKDKIIFDLDLTEKLKKVPRDKRTEAKREVAQALLSSILGDLSGSTSPVTGVRFKGLSKDRQRRCSC